jgi:hypothetical protein
MISKIQQDVVQGPLDHPRFGRSLSVYPTVETARVNRYPTQAVVVTSVARALIDLSKAGDRLQAVVVEGLERDPTEHPEFLPISQNLRELVTKWFPKAQLCLLSLRPDLEEAQVRHALNCYDQPILQLEAGTQKTATALHGSKHKPIRKQVEELGRLGVERLIVQGRFVRGTVDNSKDNEIKMWIRHLAEIRPAGVHIVAPDKLKGKKLRPVPPTRMSKIAEMVTEKTGLPVEVCAV